MPASGMSSSDYYAAQAAEEQAQDVYDLADEQIAMGEALDGMQGTNWGSAAKAALGGLSQIGGRPGYQTMVPAQSMRLAPRAPVGQQGGPPMPLRQMAPPQATTMMQSAAQNLMRRDSGSTGLGGALGTALGAVAGALIPGAGPAIGATVGGALGGALD